MKTTTNIGQIIVTIVMATIAILVMIGGDFR